MIAQAQKLKLEIEYFRAVDKTEIDLESARDAGFRSIMGHNDLALGEIACLLSHRGVLDLFLSSDDAYCAVIEDDMLLDERFLPVIRKITEKVEGWDIVKLSNDNNSKTGQKICELGHGVEIGSTMNAHRGTGGLLYTRKGAQKLRNAIKTFSRPIDTQMGYAFEEKIAILEVCPRLCKPNAIDETSIPLRSRSKRKKGFLPWCSRTLDRKRLSIRRRIWARKVPRLITLLNKESCNSQL